MLHIDLSSLEAGARGPATGGIWFEDGYTFPEAGWSDFPIVVLTWWIDLLARLASGQTNRGEISFMDGPYRVHATLTGESLQLEFVSENPGVSGASSTTTLDHTLDEAIGAARALLEECRRRGWTSDDIEDLQRSLNLAQSRTP